MIKYIVAASCAFSLLFSCSSEPKLSGVSESCDHSGECADGLGCFSNKCGPRYYQGGDRAKRCETIQCVNSDDCGGEDCVDGRCVFTQCTIDADCFDDNLYCDTGVCKQKCEVNGDCPSFFACSSGRCEIVGCSTDRECQTASGQLGSRCVDLGNGIKECGTPCSDDAACNDGRFTGSSCIQGFCQPGGCATDEECKIRFGGMTGANHVCR